VVYFKALDSKPEKSDYISLHTQCFRSEPSGWLPVFLTLETLVVTIYTIRYNIKNSRFCPESVLLCYVGFSEQQLSLYNIYWLYFIIKECVYCAVRTQSLNIIQATFSPQNFNSFKDNVIRLPVSRVYNRSVTMNSERRGKKRLWSVLCSCPSFRLKRLRESKK
jgi:hypothetical protein